MAYTVRRIDYFSTTAGPSVEAHDLLDILAGLGINLLAFTVVPIGPLHTHLTIFPEDAAQLSREAERDHLVLDGPHPALLAQGDDQVGALAEIHGVLVNAGVDVYAATGVAVGDGGFGYLIYVRPDDCSRALAALRGR